MMNPVHRSILYSALERFGSFALAVLSTAVLSRLLTPAEFGIYVTISALSALVAACTQEFGGANYLIQKPTLSQQDVRTAFTITFLMSALPAAALFALRNIAASFYSQPGMRTGIAIFTLNFLLMPFVITSSALLRRDMAFNILTRCNLTAGFAGTTASIVLTALGCGFIGPIWGSVVGNAVLTTLFMVCRRDHRIFHPCLRGHRDVLGFGAYSSAVALINIFYQSCPQLIIGRILGFTAVGLYGRAAGATQLFDRLLLGVLQPVIMPAMFARTRAGADLRGLYLRGIELITALQWPFLGFMALMAEPLVRLWFGPQWMAMVPLIRLLCVASLCSFAASLSYPVLVAAGRVRDTLVTSLISVPPSLLVIFAASFFGIRAVAASAFLTLPFQVAVALWFIRRRLDFAWADLVRATQKSGLATMCSCAGALAGVLVNDYSPATPILGLLGGGLAGLAGWWLGLTITRHPLLAEMRRAAGGLAVSVPLAPSLRRLASIRLARNSG